MHSLYIFFICLAIAGQASGDPTSTGNPANELQNNFTTTSKEPGAIVFTPPQGWKAADPKILPQSVKAMVIGQGAHEFPPSMNLGIETYQGTLKQYLQRVKEINESQGLEWKNLGNISTGAGNASLSQVDKKNEWGCIRMMHVILKKEDQIYILTASALKDEFSKFYKEFFVAMRSLHFNPTED